MLNEYCLVFCVIMNLCFEHKFERRDMKEKQIEIYKMREGEIVFDVDVEKETMWVTEAQLAELFSVDRSVINRHIRNIYRDGELDETVTCAKNAQVQYEGKRQVVRQVRRFNLDAVISVGYRVNSRKATDFRIWATKILHNYVVDGVAVNRRRIGELDEKKLRSLEGTLGLVKRLMAKNELSVGEANGILEVIAKYSNSFKALQEFDDGHVVFGRSPKSRKVISEKEATRMILELRRNVNGGELFGKPRGGSFLASLNAIYQTFDGEDVYKSVAEKAANLLYLVIKDHPFYDGNKRIGALLFIMFLTINDFHLTENGETKISDRALTALALLIAESEPEEKNLIIALVCKMLED